MRIIASLIKDERQEFGDETEIKDFLKELEGPLEDVILFGEYWKKRIPDVIQESWLELPVSTRLLVWAMGFEIQSLTASLYGFESSD